LVWSEDTLNVLTYAAAPTLDDWQKLLTWWETAGPV